MVTLLCPVTSHQPVDCLRYKNTQQMMAFILYIFKAGCELSGNAPINTFFSPLYALFLYTLLLIYTFYEPFFTLRGKIANHIAKGKVCISNALWM